MRSLTNLIKHNLWHLVAVMLLCVLIVCAMRIVRLAERIERVCESAESLIESSAVQIKRHSDGVAASKQKIDSILENADELVQSWKRRRIFPLEEGTENEHNSL